MQLNCRLCYRIKVWISSLVFLKGYIKTAIVDSSDIFPHANQQLVLPHASNRDAQDVAAKLRALEEKMQQLWDPASQKYDLWYNFTPQRRVPSQYLVFQQLKFRLEAGEPIIVGIVAPAGYGKSELIAAFLLHA